MDPIASFSGLASGIDWRKMVDQIIQVESRPISLYEGQIQDAEDEQSAWEAFQSKVGDLDSAVSGLADASAFAEFSTTVSGYSSATGAPVSASVDSTASAGAHQVKILQMATNEKLGSDVFSSRTEALGISGEFLVNGVAVQVDATDSVDDVVSAFNRANTGTGASGVTASVLTTGAEEYHIVLTSDDSGARGIDVADGSGGALLSLGFLDGSTEVKNTTSDGARSDGFVSSTGTLGTLLSLQDAPSPAAVTLAAGSTNEFTATLDLSTMSLSDVADEINTAAAAAGSSVTASVVTETDDAGTTSYRLDIDGTTSFTDANGILETLGILEGGRSDVTEVLQSGSAFTDGDGSTTATGSTVLTDLWLEGAATGVTAGDTFSLSGTRGDGSTFTKTYTVGVGDTLQDLVDALNSSIDGFGAGDRSASAAVAGDGSLTVTDGTAGGSQLALSIVANNEGGGTLDFGDFSVSQAGRAREIVAGLDAQLEVDGTFLTRSSNSVSDVVAGVTLKALAVSDTAVTVDVDRNVQAISGAIQELADTYNALSEWVSDQFSGAGAEEGVENKPLSGNSVLRQMRSNLSSAMRSQLTAAVGGDLTRLADVGIEIDRDGLFQVDSETLNNALATDMDSVIRLFGDFGTGSVNALDYVQASDETTPGTYDVEITQAAAQAAVTGSGFGGTYADDGTPDTLTVRDLGTSSNYSVALSDGMSLSEIVEALNSEFNSPEVHQVQASETMYSDAVGTEATDSTLLQDLYAADGSSFGVADGDVITLSGTRADGSSFLEELSVTDVTTQTLGDLRAAVESAVGSSEAVTWEEGNLTVTAQSTGRSALSLSISSNNAGGGSLSFGAVDTVTEGRSTVDITASDEGGELRLAHDDYGSSAGFEISYAAGGADGTASLGLTAGTHTGTDVAGTIGGRAATGSGRLLTGDEETDVEGLMIRYEGADTGSVGNITFSRGIASAVSVQTDLLMGSEAGSIEDVIEGMDPMVERLNDRIDALEDRLDRRREFLIRKFSAMEEAMSQAQQQSQWLSAQFSALSGGGFGL